jgi:hypothetical protein
MIRVFWTETSTHSASAMAEAQPKRRRVRDTVPDDKQALYDKLVDVVGHHAVEEACIEIEDRLLMRQAIAAAISANNPELIVDEFIAQDCFDLRSECLDEQPNAYKKAVALLRIDVTAAMDGTWQE